MGLELRHRCFQSAFECQDPGYRMFHPLLNHRGVLAREAVGYRQQAHQGLGAHQAEHEQARAREQVEDGGDDEQECRRVAHSNEYRY